VAALIHAARSSGCLGVLSKRMGIETSIRLR
jgi:hypothetical protein